MSDQDKVRARRQPSRFATWLAHRAAPLWLLGGVFYVLGDTLESTWLAMAYSAAAMITIGATLSGTLRHEDGLCARCTVPADGGEQAEQRARLLRLRHRFRAHPFRTLVLPCGATMVPAALLLWLLGYDPLIALALAYAAIAGLSYLQGMHRRLAWWCPECGWDDAATWHPEMVPGDRGA